MSTAQAAIPFEAPASIVETNFLRHIATEDGAKLVLEATKRAFALKARGFRSFSMDAIFHSIRWDASITLGPNHGFKVNDQMSAHMARLLMNRHPELEGFFQLRELRGRTYRGRAKR